LRSSRAGGRDNWIWFHIPVGYLFAIGNPRSDWMFKTEPDPRLDGRSLAYPRGKVVGGSSAINAMIYMRGQASDYDRWRQMGLTGWGWSDVLPLFRKCEDHFGGETEFHGAGGAWRVDKPRVRWEVLDAFAEAARIAGIPSTEDFNCGDNEGCGYFQVNQKDGRRLSAARAFLEPALKRPNLTLITGALAERVVFDGRKATGVVIRENGKERTLLRTREVIVSTGAVMTPPLLERSGIGDAERLRALGVEVLQHAPGVGANLQDHLQLRLIYTVKGVRTLNRDNRSNWKRLKHGDRICAVAHGAADHGAIAVGRVHAFLAGVRDAESAVPYPALVARQVWRSAARVRRVSRRAWPICVRAAGARFTRARRGRKMRP
jgi:choline dehydrogenase-like flavoprotein